ncbi:alanine dehydrogenase [Candidatus Geothermarchaeota archaeon ex4572_27]|nr:MAG: alanine dehydrogenase [Candidatus Geothermarchaeota archaeon ex4572_27]
MKTLLLTQDDIRSILDVREAIRAVEEVFRDKALGRVQMPPKVYLYFREFNGDLRVMPSYVERLNVSSVKVVNSHPDNPSRSGLPTVMATILLIDPKTGFPLSIMDGTYVTAVRTAAAGVIAIKYLAREGFEKVGLIGAGVQGTMQAKTLLQVYRDQVREIRVYDLVREKSDRLCRELNREFGEVAKVAESAREAVEGADVIITLTPSRKPIVMSEWVSDGTHLNCMGADAPGKQEVDPQVLKRAKIVVDDLEQAVHSGEVNVPISQGILSKDDIYGELGEVVAGLKRGRTSESEVTVFVSTGLAIQDTAVAYLAYRLALEKGVGREISLFPT